MPPEIIEQTFSNLEDMQAELERGCKYQVIAQHDFRINKTGIIEAPYYDR